MDINIRKAIKQNMNNASYDDVKETVDDALTSGEEKLLPGLGVLFELLYKGSSETDKTELLNKIVKELQ